ncbi:MAG: alkaline phosphatase family protein [Candidatus Omnitrophota bacterium]
MFIKKKNGFKKKSRDSQDKIILIGIDGATWKVMQPLIEEGKLPNMARLIREGSSGVLLSQEPLISPVIWASIATGKRPEKHGITDFANKKKNSYNFDFFTSSDRKVKAFWNILSDYGLSVGLINWWTTWPSEKINGYIVSDHFLLLNLILKGLTKEELMDSDIPGLTYPEKILKTVQRYQKIRNIPKAFSYQGHKEISIEEALQFIRRAKSEEINIAELEKSLLISKIKSFCLQDKRTFLIGRDLLKESPVDLFAIYLEGVDVVQHYFWEFYEPQAEGFNFHPTKEEIDLFGKIIPEYYEWQDTLIGELLDNFNMGKTTVIIVSDHGFGAFHDPFPYVVALNFIFERLGWLEFKENKIFWPQSTVYEPIRFKGQYHAVCLNLQGREPEGVVKADEYEEMKRTINNMLTGLKTTDGEKVFEDVRMIENPIEEDLDFEVKINTSLSPEDKLFIKGEAVPLKKFLVPNPRGGDHAPEGVIILSGSHIKKGQVIGGATIYDVTPTILSLLGIPVGKDMDGKPLLEAIEEDYLKRIPSVFIDSHDSVWEAEESNPHEIIFDEEMKEKLKSIGYMQ